MEIDLKPPRRILNYAEKRESVARRKENKLMHSLGYRKNETDPEIIRGGYPNYEKIIIDAKISRCGKYVWTLTGLPEVKDASSKD